MRSFLLPIAIVALLLLPMGCVDEEQITQDVLDNLIQQATGSYTIKVGGTAGLDFAGEYKVFFYTLDPGTYSWDYLEDRYSVEGQVPTEYTFEGMVARGLFQKLTGDGTLLAVEIWKDGVLQDSTSTTDPWGAVMVAGGP